MVDMRKYTSILTFRTQHSTRSVYLERATNCSSSLGQMYFSFSTKRIHFTVNTKSKNTKQQCVHLGVRDTPHPQIYFSFGKTLISVLTSKLNHSWFQNNRTKTLPRDRLSRPSQNVRPRTKHHQMQMLILNRLRLKARLFSNTVSPNNDVFKAKSLSKMRHYNQLEKSSRKFWFANKITLNKTQQ